MFRPYRVHRQMPSSLEQFLVDKALMAVFIANLMGACEGGIQMTVNALIVCYVYHVQCCGFNILCNYL